MRSRRIVLAAAIFGLLCALCALYFFIDPMEARWMPRCLWKVATGTDCPGCGSQRMAHALLHGDLGGAWRANAYGLCMLPLVGLLLWLEFFRERHPGLYGRMHSPVAVWALAGSVIAWWIVRNLI